MKVYQPNVENMQTYLKDNTSDGPVWYNLPSGMCSVRILPPWDPSGRVALPVFSHRIEFQGKSMKFKKYSWTCIDKTFGKPCKICESLNSLKAAGVDISEYEPNSRTFYCNVVVMYDPEYDREVKSGKNPATCSGTAPGTHALMRLPKTIYDWIVSQITNPMVGDITSIDNGIDIYVTREGSGLNTTYSATLSPNGRTAIPQEYLDKIDVLYNLDDIFSTGFDDDVVNELSEYLSRSSRMLGSGVPNMASQMSGIPNQGYYAPQSQQYQQPQVQPQQYQQPVQGMGYPGSQPVTPVAPVANFAAPPAFGQGVTTPVQVEQPKPTSFMSTPQQQMPQGVPTSAAQSANAIQTPECFGKYNPGDIKCVTCSCEVPCSKSKV